MNKRGTYIAPNKGNGTNAAQQGNLSASSEFAAERELENTSTTSQSLDGDGFDAALEAAFAPDLAGIFADSGFELNDAPTLDSLMSGGNYLHGGGQPNPLDTPKPRPGFEQRLISYSLNGKGNNDRVHVTTNRGFVPRRWSSLSDSEKKRWKKNVIDNGKSGDGIIVVGKGNYVLCERRAEVAEAERAYYGSINREQMVAAEQRFSGDVKNRHTNTDFGFEDARVMRGTRRPTVAPDRSN